MRKYVLLSVSLIVYTEYLQLANDHNLKTIDDIKKTTQHIETLHHYDYLPEYTSHLLSSFETKFLHF